MVAAFGGVCMDLPRGRIRVHPLALLLLCIPLFVTQSATLIYLRLSQDLDKPISGDVESQTILPFAKILMIYMLALMLYPELLVSCRLILFLVNPTTWTDIERVDPDDPEETNCLGWCWNIVFIAPISLMSEMLKFYIGCEFAMTMLFLLKSFS